MNFKPYKNTVQLSLTPDETINVLQYLPIEDKHDLIAVSI
jgi:hypothetical protein